MKEGEQMIHARPLTENEKNTIALKVLDVLIQHQLSNREANEVLSRVTELKNELKLYQRDRLADEIFNALNETD
jgi:hypothetical protein